MRRWIRRAAIGGAVLAVLLAVVVHTPPVRRAVLRRVVATLADRFDIALGADNLRYDLLARRVALSGVRIAAIRSPDDPFLTADLIEISVPRSALFGAFAIDRVRLDNGHLRIRRRADGTTNLPESGSGDTGEPQAIPIGQLSVPRLAVTLEDAGQQLSLVLPALAVDVRETAGTIRLVAPGRLTRRGVVTAVREFGGGAAFDGRSVQLTRFAAAIDQGRVVVDGALAVFVREPRADLRVSGTTDVAALAGWLETDPGVEGVVEADGSVAGPFGDPAANLRLRSTALRWQNLTVADIDAPVRIDASGVALTQATATVADGRVAADARITRPDGDMTLAVSWFDVDLARVIRDLEPTAAPRPGGGMSGSATIRGAMDDVETWSVEARARLTDRGVARDALAVPGTSVFTLARGRWRLEADHAVEGVPLRARVGGRLVTPRFAASTIDGTVIADDVDVARLLAALRRAGLADLPADRAGDARMRADVRLTGTFAAMRAMFDARLRQGEANQATATGTVLVARGRLDAHLSARLRQPRSMLPDVPVDAIVEAEFDVQGPLARLTAKGTMTAFDAAYEQIHVGRLDAVVDANADRVLADVVAPELGARARTSVMLGGPRTVSIDLQVDDAELTRLTRDLNTPVPVSGVVSLTARGEAPLEQWRRGRGTVELSRLDARVGDLPVRIASTARGSFDRDAFDIDRLEADLGRLRLSVMGRLPATAAAAAVADAAALRAFLVGDVADVADAIHASGLAALPAVDGRGQLALVARVTGSAEAPVLAADLDVSEGELAFADLPAVRRINIRAHVGDGWIEPLVISGEWQQSRVSAAGRIPIRLFEEYLPSEVIAALPATTGPATVTARAESITPQVLAPFVAPDALSQIAGAVDASLRLETSSLAPEAVVGELRLDRLDVRIAGLPITQREPTRIAFGDGVAHIAAWDWTGQGATLGVQGQVRLADGVAAILAAGRFDVRLLTPFVRDSGVTLSGTLAPRLSVAGPVTDPRIDGELALESGEIRLRDPRIVATGLNAFAVLTPSEMRLTSLAGVVNGGTLNGTGNARYRGEAPASGRISATIAGMGLEMPEGLRSELDVDAAVGLVNAADGLRGDISGTVTVLRSAYREPLAVVTGLLNALRAERLAAVAAEPDSLASRMALDLRVVTDTDIIVDNNIARLELGGDLRVIGTVGAPALAGRATLREGGQLFLGRNVYTIDTGTIDFTDPVTIDPELNVEATTRAGGQEIGLTLRGTPDSLTVDLRSDDPAIGQADLASLLLTGRTLEQVPGSEAQIVGEQVLAYLSGDVLGIAGRAVGLDTIRLGGPDVAGLRRDPTDLATETNPTSRLTFGKSVGRNIDLTYSQSLRDGEAQTWIVDYQPIRQVNLRLVNRDDHLRSYEFRHDLSLGGPSRAPRATRAFDQQEVASVSLGGETGDLAAALRAALRLEPGDTFDFSEWQRDRDRIEAQLHAAGFLEARVTTERADAADGVVLTYQVSTGPRTRIAVNGYEPSAGTRQQIAQAWALSVFDDFLEEEASAIVGAALGADGYLEAGVTAEVTPGDPKTLTVAVRPGPRAVDRRLAITADDPMLAADLAEWAYAAGIDVWREPETVEDALAGELRARGYLRSQVNAGVPTIDGSTAVLPITIEAGPAFTIGELSFAGAQRLPVERLRDVVGVAAGDRYDPVALDAARGRIDAAYRREAFTAARATVEATPAADSQQVPVTFRIEEGPRQVVGEIAIRGNRGIDRDVIARNMQLAVGEPLAANAWIAARARLFETGLFRRVDVTTEPMEPGAAETDRPTRLIVTVEEWPALRVRYGFQLSEERPQDQIEGRDLTPGLSGDVTRRTLFGRAVTLGAAAEYQRRERLGRFFVNAPTMFGWRIESLLAAERSRRTFADATFVTDRTGLSWEQRTRLGPSWQLSYAYRYDRDHTFDTEPNPLLPSFDVVANVARVTGAVAYDTRNDPTDTSRGILTSWSFEVAPESLGSDFRFVRHIGQAYYFRPWRDVVFASAARIGLVSPLGDQALLPSEYLRAGGAGTVRGVPEESLGPRDIFGDAAGGRGLLVLNQEARFPVFRWVRGVGFIDSGNVFETPDSIGFGRLVTSIGAGLRVSTPFALLRTDVARVIRGEPTTNMRTLRWTFGIGHTF